MSILNKIRQINLQCWLAQSHTAWKWWKYPHAMIRPKYSCGKPVDEKSVKKTRAKKESEKEYWEVGRNSREVVRLKEERL